MIRFFMLFFLTTFSFLCLLLAYLNFAMISRIEARRVSTVQMLDVIHNDMLNVFNRTPAGIEKEALVDNGLKNQHQNNTQKNQLKYTQMGLNF